MGKLTWFWIQSLEVIKRPLQRREVLPSADYRLTPIIVATWEAKIRRIKV
jgi:hypothetical protein